MLKKSLLLFLLTASTALAAAETPAKTAKDDPYLLLELFGTTFQDARKEYVDEISDRKAIEAAINGMFSSLDPHSSFMDEDTFRDMQIQTKGEFGGVGMEVSTENGFVRVISPIDDTPAAKAGIQPGDLITHIDDESVIDMNLNEAVKRLRGKPKTNVKLMIRRGNKEPFELTLERAIIKIKSVKYSVKDNDIGYIRIITFSEDTTSLLEKGVKELTNQIGKDKIKGFILDVRNNPGGLLEQATGVVDTFLEKGEIVSTRSRVAEGNVRLSAQKGDMTEGLPLVVLINEGSASASEIVAGALQDHRRGLIVGTPSFGKGSVQTLKPIPGFGAIKITTARYYTPSGRSIQAEGIQPDILIPRAEIKEEPIIKGFSESNLPNALGQKAGEKKDKVQAKKNDTPKTSKDEKDGKDDKAEKPDYQLNRALDILHSIAIYKEQGKSN